MGWDYTIRNITTGETLDGSDDYEINARSYQRYHSDALIMDLEYIFENYGWNPKNEIHFISDGGCCGHIFRIIYRDGMLYRCKYMEGTADIFTSYKSLWPYMNGELPVNETLPTKTKWCSHDRIVGEDWNDVEDTY